MKAKKLCNLMIFFFILILLSSCVQSKDNTSYEEDKITRAYMKNENEKRKFYPLTVLDSLNRKVTIISEPKRVISLAPNISEIICALNKEALIVGRTGFCDFPEIMSKIDSVGDFYEPDIDKIIELKPDLVITSSLTFKSTLKKLDDNGITYVSMNEDKTLEGTYTMIKKIGDIFHAQEKSKELITSMKEQVTYVYSKVKKLNRPSVVYISDVGYISGKNTFIDDMLKSAGAFNAAEDYDYYQKVSTEDITKINPDIIIAPERIIDTMMNNDEYQIIKAVKNKKFFAINEDLISRQGPRIAEGIETIARLIHPEVFKD